MQWKCRLHIFIKYIHVCLKILNYFFHPLSKQFFVLNTRTDKHLINSYTCMYINNVKYMYNITFYSGSYWYEGTCINHEIYKACVK